MKESISFDDERLMQEIKDGNVLAFDILYKKYSKRIFNFTYSILKSTEDSENIVQDVFLNLWGNRHKVEKNSSIKCYIFTIAYNSAISIIRKKIRESQFIEYLISLQDLEQNAVNIELEYNELKDTFNDIINHLPARQKEVYLFHNVEGLKYQEIAERLNISVNTIETHMSRALKTIQEKLGKSSLLAMLFYSLFV